MTFLRDTTPTPAQTALRVRALGITLPHADYNPAGNSSKRTFLADSRESVQNPGQSASLATDFREAALIRDDLILTHCSPDTHSHIVPDRFPASLL